MVIREGLDHTLKSNQPVNFIDNAHTVGEKRKQVYVHLSEIPKVPNRVVKVLVVCEHRQTDF